MHAQRRAGAHPAVDPADEPAAMTHDLAGRADALAEWRAALAAEERAVLLRHE